MSARQFFLVSLSMLLFISSFITAIGISSFALLHSESYTPYLEKNGVYSYVNSLVPEQMRALIPSNESLNAIANMVINQTFAYINGEIDTLNLIISVDSPQVQDYVKQRVEEFPVCAEGVDPLRDGVLCRPAGMSTDQIVEQILSVPEVKTQSIDLAQTLNQDGRLSKVRDSVATYKKAVYICAIASAVLIALIMLIGWPTRRRGLLHAGIPIFVSGALLLSISFFGDGFAKIAIERYIPDMGNSSLGALAADVASNISGKFMANAAVTAIVGLILVVCAFLLQRKQEEK